MIGLAGVLSAIVGAGAAFLMAMGFEALAAQSDGVVISAMLFGFAGYIALLIYTFRFFCWVFGVHRW